MNLHRSVFVCWNLWSRMEEVKLMPAMKTVQQTNGHEADNVKTGFSFTVTDLD